MNLTVLQDGSEQVHYDDPRIPLYIRRGNLRSLSNMAALCHWHDDVELLLARKGHLCYSINGTKVQIGEGNAVFVNARQMHFGFSDDGTDCEYVCVAFRPQSLFGNEELTRRYVLPILSSPQFSHMILERDSHGALLDQILQLDELYQNREEGFELPALAAVIALWHGLYGWMGQQISKSPDADSGVWVIRQMLDHIRTHYPEKVTLDSIANAGGVCRTKCCRMFREYLGMTANDYLNSFRLEKSMELLKSTDLSVTEIAAACGYSGSSYFAELFSREKGCTPTQYRKQ